MRKKQKGGEMDIRLLCEKIIGCAFNVHNNLGFGFLEKVYENALAIELNSIEGLSARKQYPIPVFYKECKVGEYFADLFVNDLLIVEVKSVFQLVKEHEAQLVHYLKATEIDHGLLINFGPSVVVKHKYREYLKKTKIKSCSS
ncbi:MAG: GxxExxY protein [Anaerolineales bacterium]|nr:GxxExxY protein [Anaerolineales bacterium]